MKTAESKSPSENRHSWSPNLKNESFFHFTQPDVNSFFGPANIQPKLKIGESDDQYERQADRFADAVLSMPENTAPVQRKPAEEEEKLQAKRESILQRKCQECEQGEGLQLKIADSGSPAQISGDPISTQLQSKSGSGSRLPASIQSEMSQKMGADFSGVNIHNDTDAAQLNKSLSARAFTHGSNIYFNKGEYNPSSREGKHLLAHELTHVVQQNSTLHAKRIQRNGGPIMSGMRDPSEIANRRPPVVEITAIDARVEGDWYMPPSYAGWLAAATRIGEVEMTDVTTMVDNVLNRLGDDQNMSRLNILDHGNENWIQIGDDWINHENISQYSAELSRLSSRFTNNGFVHLQNCKAGQNTALMAELASILGVSIYAGTGLHNPIYRVNLGDYVRVDPDGTIHEDVGRP